MLEWRGIHDNPPGTSAVTGACRRGDSATTGVHLCSTCILAGDQALFLAQLYLNRL